MAPKNGKDTCPAAVPRVIAGKVAQPNPATIMLGGQLKLSEFINIYFNITAHISVEWPFFFLNGSLPSAISLTFTGDGSGLAAVKLSRMRIIY